MPGGNSGRNYSEACSHGGRLLHKSHQPGRTIPFTCQMPAQMCGLFFQPGRWDWMSEGFNLIVYEACIAFSEAIDRANCRHCSAMELLSLKAFVN